MYNENGAIKDVSCIYCGGPTKEPKSCCNAVSTVTSCGGYAASQLRNLSTQELPSISIRRPLMIQRMPCIEIPKTCSGCCPATCNFNIGIIDCTHESVLHERMSLCCPCSGQPSGLRSILCSSPNMSRQQPCRPFESQNCCSPQSCPPPCKNIYKRCSSLDQSFQQSEAERELMMYLQSQQRPCGPMGPTCRSSCCIPQQEEVTRDCIQTIPKSCNNPCCHQSFPCAECCQEFPKCSCKCQSRPRCCKLPCRKPHGCSRRKCKLINSPYAQPLSVPCRQKCERKRKYMCKCDNSDSTSEEFVPDEGLCSIIVSCSPKSCCCEQPKNEVACTRIPCKPVATIPCSQARPLGCKPVAVVPCCETRQMGCRMLAALEAEFAKKLMRTCSQPCTCSKERCFSTKHCHSNNGPLTENLLFSSSSKLNSAQGTVAKGEDQPERDDPAKRSGSAASKDRSVPGNVTPKSSENTDSDRTTSPKPGKLQSDKSKPGKGDSTSSSENDIAKKKASVLKRNGLNPARKYPDIAESKTQTWYSVVTSAWPKAVQDAVIDSIPCDCPNNSLKVSFPECCETSPSPLPRVGQCCCNAASGCCCSTQKGVIFKDQFCTSSPNISHLTSTQQDSLSSNEAKSAFSGKSDSTTYQFQPSESNSSPITDYIQNQRITRHSRSGNRTGRQRKNREVIESIQNINVTIDDLKDPNNCKCHCIVHPVETYRYKPPEVVQQANFQYDRMYKNSQKLQENIPQHKQFQNDYTTQKLFQDKLNCLKDDNYVTWNDGAYVSSPRDHDLEENSPNNTQTEYEEGSTSDGEINYKKSNCPYKRLLVSASSNCSEACYPSDTCHLTSEYDDLIEVDKWFENCTC